MPATPYMPSLASLNSLARVACRSVVWTLALALALSCIRPAPAAEPPGTLTFEQNVAPLLAQHCQKCHGAEKREAGLDVRRRGLLLSGGDGGPAIVPGDAEKSLLWKKISAGEMPPQDEPPLPAEARDTLLAWIVAGAPLADATEPPLDDAKADSRVTPQDREFWSFRPPVRPETPTVKAQDRVRTPIDAFLLARLEAKGLGFNADASQETLLRRLYFDLHGMPPTPEEREAFLNDASPDAYERLVDRLLDSPRYGERWGRHWLDVAGYADSDGYLAADRLRPEAWRYRDYVIRALNKDLPYDRFVRQQLAGDELLDWRSAEELTPDMAENLVATGFLRTASDPTYPGYIEPNECHQVIGDTIQIVSTTFLGLTLHCARCHAHKFDPLSQRDYYALHAVLLAAYDPEQWQPSEVRGIPLATDAEKRRNEETDRQATERIAQLQATLGATAERYRKKLTAEKLSGLAGPIDENFDGGVLDSRWTAVLAGTAKGWQSSQAGGVLQVSNIQGDPGYAIVKLVRSVVLKGEFDVAFDFSWNSTDSEPANNVAMQAAIVNLRDAQGNTVACRGYIDENNTARGSTIAAVGVGPDAVAHYVGLHGQAVPPSDKARALAPAGTARTTIRRDSAGRITTGFDDGRLQDTFEGSSAATVTSVEIEFRRYVLEPGAAFEGLTVDRLHVAAGPNDMADPALETQLAAALATAEAARNDEQKRLVAQFAPSLTIGEPQLAERFPDYADEAARLQAAIAAEEGLKKPLVLVRGLIDIDGDPRPQHVFQRGEFVKPGALVEPGVPEVLATPDYKLAVNGNAATSGRRRAFADWLTCPENPLTARVQANRIWAQHFGRGLTPTVANFGHSGVAPTHPELLDWLASEFVARGWSLKAMHRLMLRSTAYRQSSEYDAAKAGIDPDNLLLWSWRARRHEGEAVRDSLLAVSGKLNPTMFGPPIPVQSQSDGSVTTGDTPAGNRRSIYLQVRRSQQITMLELFDTPTMEINCPQRNESIVPMQALAMLHGPFTEQCAAALAARLRQEAPGDRRGQIDRAYKLLFSREVSDGERARIEAFLDACAADTLGDRAAGASPAEVDAAAQGALVQAALVWLNSNEFMYLD